MFFSPILEIFLFIGPFSDWWFWVVNFILDPPRLTYGKTNRNVDGFFCAPHGFHRSAIFLVDLLEANYQLDMDVKIGFNPF